MFLWFVSAYFFSPAVCLPPKLVIFASICLPGLRSGTKFKVSISWCSHFIHWCWGHHRPSCVACFLVPRQALSFALVGWGGSDIFRLCSLAHTLSLAPVLSSLKFVVFLPPYRKQKSWLWGPDPSGLLTVDCQMFSVSVPFLFHECLLCFWARLCLFGFLFLYFSLITFS